MYYHSHLSCWHPLRLYVKSRNRKEGEEKNWEKKDTFNSLWNWSVLFIFLLIIIVLIFHWKFRHFYSDIIFPPFLDFPILIVLWKSFSRWMVAVYISWIKPCIRSYSLRPFMCWCEDLRQVLQACKGLLSENEEKTDLEFSKKEI